MTAMRTSEVLNTAADLIEKRGWAVGVGWKGDDATLCIEGGIAAAMGVAGGPGYRCAAYSAVCSYLQREEHGLCIWNDKLPFDMPAWQVDHDFLAANDEAAAHVIEVLRSAALIESAREEQDAAWQSYATNVERVTV